MEIIAIILVYLFSMISIMLAISVGITSGLKNFFKDKELSKMEENVDESI